MSHEQLKHSFEVRPAFYDVDPMAIVWHGNYLRYFELARSAHLSQLGYDYEAMKASGYSWPIVDTRLKYIRPATLKQRLIVHTEIVEWELRLKMNYRIEDADTHQKMTTGYTMQVAVSLETNEMQFASPKVLWERLGVK